MLNEEKTLLSMIAGGSQAAFRKLFEYYYPRVLTFLESFISNREDARDTGQNVFAKIWVMRETLTEIRSFGAYLYRLSRNAAVDYCRSKRIRIPITDNYEDVRDTSPDEEYFARERSLQYRNCLENMPERRREVFNMSRDEGLSNEEISRRLGISKKTVENHLNAALRELRKITSCISVFL